ncbi:hypothetical protein PFISCL1PPCAC_8299, partial [Pristionchus fissidentatus]
DGMSDVDESRVRKVLAELRQRNHSNEVAADIARLEALLDHPVFRKKSIPGSRPAPEPLRPEPTSTSFEKKSSHSSNSTVSHSLVSRPPVEALRQALRTTLGPYISPNQKVVYVELDTTNWRPKLDEEKRSTVDGAEHVFLKFRPPPLTAERVHCRIRVGDSLLSLTPSDCSSPPLLFAPLDNAARCDRLHAALAAG